MSDTLEDIVNKMQEADKTPDVPVDSELKVEFEKNNKIVTDGFNLMREKGERSEAEIDRIKKSITVEFAKSQKNITELCEEKLRLAQEKQSEEVQRLRVDFEKGAGEKDQDKSFALTFRNWLRNGDANLSEVETSKYLTKQTPYMFEKGAPGADMVVQNNSAGGFLIRPQEVLRIAEERDIISNLMDMVTTDIVTTNTVTIPVIARSGDFSVWVDEQGSGTQQSINVREITFTTHALNSSWAMSRKYLNAAIDPERRISTETVKNDNRAINQAILRGTGVNQPLGIFNTLAEGGGEGFTVKTTGTTGKIKIADLKQPWAVQHMANYRADSKWYMSTGALAEIRFEEGTTGQFKWATDSMVGGIPLSLNGQQVIEIFELDQTIASGSIPLMYGDLKSAYQMVESTDSYMIRDEISQSDKQRIKFVFFRSIDGRPVDYNALTVLKVK